MRAVLLHRSSAPHPLEARLAAQGIPIIRSLAALLPPTLA
jgi:hypothetical protein